MKHRALIIGLFIALALVDGVLKYFAITHPLNAQTSPLSPFLALTFHQNPGITFDLAVPFTFLIPITIAILFGLAYQERKLRATQPRVALGIVAVFVGAVDNLIDRMVNGFTTDYIMVLNTSVINLADVLIVLGAIIILVYYHTNPHPRRA